MGLSADLSFFQGDSGGPKVSNAILVHIGVLTSDLGRALSFWRDLLGLRIIEERRSLVILSDGLHNITLIQRNTSAKAGIDGESAPVHIGVRVDDLAAALQGCLDLGLEITCDDIDNCRPYDPDNPPVASFKVQDMDGVLVDITASTSQWLGVAL
jgi:catechol 2,3-dioxygenase-like lactoylglutathione lyase family enzyme